MKSIGLASLILAIFLAVALNSAAAQSCDSTTQSRLVVIDPSHNGGMIAWHGDMNATYAIVKNNTSGIPQLTIKDVKVIGTFAGTDGNTTIARMNISWNEIFALEWMEVKNENGQVIAKLVSRDLDKMKNDWNCAKYPALNGKSFNAKGYCERTVKNSLLYRDDFGPLTLRGFSKYPNEVYGYAGFLNFYAKLVGF